MVNIIIGASVFVMSAIVADGLGSAGIIAFLFCVFLMREKTGLRISKAILYYPARILIRSSFR